MLLQPNRQDLWWWRSVDAGQLCGFTCRRGGVSASPWRGLNLGNHVGDEPEAVQRNRERLAADCGVPVSQLVFMDQVHGHEVVQVTADSPATVGPADAMFTDTDRVLVVLVADCVPVLVTSACGGLVGVAHAGRPGMVAGVVPALVTAMRAAGGQELSAIVGPSISSRQYEVPAAMRAEVAEIAPEAASVTGWGTPAIDVAAGVLTQLADLGVPVQTIAGCTASEADLFSYRAEGQTGRIAGVIACHNER